MDTDLEALRKQALSLYEAENYLEAETRFRELVKALPNSAEDHFDLARSLLAQGEPKYSDALEAFSRAESLWAAEGSPNRAWGLRNVANMLRLLGKSAQAEPKIREALLIEPDKADFQNMLGLVLQAQGKANYQAAIEAFQKAASGNDATASTTRKYALCNWGDTLRYLARHEDAEAKYREALAVDGDYAVARDGLGLALQGQEKYQAALEEFERTEAFWQDQPRSLRYALAHQATALRLLKRLSQAESKIRRAIEIDAEGADLHDSLGLVLRDQGKDKYPAAIECFAKATELHRRKDPASVKYALANWAETLRWSEKFQEAEAKCREIIALDPAYALAHNSLGLALQAQGAKQYTAAIASFERADKLWRDESMKDRKYALTNLADTLRLVERLVEAEARCREAIDLDPRFARAHEILGHVLQARGKDSYAAALEEFARADALYAAQDSKQRKYTLWNWGWLLGKMEDNEQALEKFRLAVAADPDDWECHYTLANGLADCRRYLDALEAYEVSIKRDDSQYHAHHNKAHYLFFLGRYAEGWSTWAKARAAYEKGLAGALRYPVDLDRATYFASVLGSQYVDREGAERWYRAVLASNPDHQPALTGLATLYLEWAKSEKPSPTALAQVSYASKKAMDALKGRLGKGDGWRNAMDLATYCIDMDDFVAAAEWLGRAEAVCGDSIARRAEIASRCGILHAKKDQFDKAAERFQEALRSEPADLKTRTNLAEAYLKQKQFGKAEEEYRKVLAIAPGNVEALIGSAQVCIEFAEGGELDRCTQAEKHLGEAIKFGEQSYEGSKRLMGKELAQVYYLRGYVRVKRYEGDGGIGAPWTLNGAEGDFKRCRSLDGTNHKADSALEKLRKKLATTRRDRLFDGVGPLIVCLAATAVFVFAQMDFFFAGRKPLGIDWFTTRRITETGYYALLSFGAIVFMVAGLYLPKVLKLKVGAIELEKAAVEQISTPTSLGISR